MFGRFRFLTTLRYFWNILSLKIREDMFHASLWQCESFSISVDFQMVLIMVTSCNSDRTLASAAGLSALKYRRGTRFQDILFSYEKKA